jgi:RNA methyltransferase, TrmH family
MKEIISVQNPLIKDLYKLHQKKGREQRNQSLIEGYHLVEEAYKAGLLEKVLIVQKEDAIMGVENYVVSQEIIQKLSFVQSPQPIVGVVSWKKENQGLSERVLVLADVMDPGNVGTLIRSALGFGFMDVILSEDSVELYNDKVVRASQGAIFHLQAKHAPLQESIQDLKTKGYVLVGTSIDGVESIEELKGFSKIAVVVGNEAEGIPLGILKEMEHRIKIPMNPTLESFNAAVAGSIVMYHLRKQGNNW